MISRKRIIGFLVLFFAYFIKPIFAFYTYGDVGFFLKKYSDISNTSFMPFIEGSIRYDFFKIKGRLAYEKDKPLYDSELDTYNYIELYRYKLGGSVYLPMSFKFSLIYEKQIGDLDYSATSKDFSLSYEKDKYFVEGFYSLFSSTDYISTIKGFSFSYVLSKYIEVPIEFRFVDMDYSDSSLSYNIFSFGIDISFTDDISSEVSLGFGKDSENNSVFEFSLDFFYIVSPPTKLYLAYYYSNFYNDLEYNPQSSFILFVSYGLDYYKE
jgi:hypothetical protein